MKILTVEVIGDFPYLNVSNFIAMKALFSIVLCIIAILACKRQQAPDESASCQGQGVVETLRTAQGIVPRVFDITHQIRCSGTCPDGTACDTIIDPRSGMLTNKRTWCGCKGDTKPRACDVILEEIDTFIHFICTPLLEGCPSKGDSCILVSRDVTDTIRTAVTNIDSIYRRRQIFTCECLNRGPI